MGGVSTDTTGTVHVTLPVISVTTPPRQGGGGRVEDAEEARSASGEAGIIEHVPLDPARLFDLGEQALKLTLRYSQEVGQVGVGGPAAPLCRRQGIDFGHEDPAEGGDAPVEPEIGRNPDAAKGAALARGGGHGFTSDCVAQPASVSRQPSRKLPSINRRASSRVRITQLHKGAQMPMPR